MHETGTPGASTRANLEKDPKAKWKGLYLSASISSILMFVFIIVQIIVYSI